MQTIYARADSGFYCAEAVEAYQKAVGTGTAEWIQNRVPALAAVANGALDQLYRFHGRKVQLRADWRIALVLVFQSEHLASKHGGLQQLFLSYPQLFFLARMGGFAYAPSP